MNDHCPRRPADAIAGGQGFRWRVGAPLLLVGVALSACYRYVPISDDSPVPHEDVRIRITEDAAARLSKDLGVFSTSIDGQYAPQGSDSVSVAIPIDREYRGVTVGSTTQTLFLGRSEIVAVQRREFDRRRTVLLSAGVVAGFAALAASIVQIGDPNDPSDNHPIQPPPSVRRPVAHGFAIRIPLP